MHCACVMYVAKVSLGGALVVVVGVLVATWASWRADSIDRDRMLFMFCMELP